MKELSIEEKARNYDEALEKARQLCAYPTSEPFISDLQDLFPQLKENEDEKVRKWLIGYLENRILNCSLIDEKENCKTAVAWLEKQGKNNMGISEATKQKLEDSLNKALEKETPESWNKFLDEQKPTDKVEQKFKVGDKVKKGYLTYTVEDIDEDSYKLQAYSKDGNKGSTVFLTIGYEKDYELVEQKSINKVEPKFKVGDFIINDYCFGKVIALTNDAYLLDTGQGIPFSCEHNAHLWTIQDAKDGDVLVCPLPKGYEGENQIFIFKCINSRDYVDDCIEYYCRVCHGVFYENENKTGYMGTTSSPLYPATKEQRDTLMKAMADEGYTFDFEKKELRKLKFRVGDIVKSKSQPMLDARKIISIGKDCYWCEDRGCIGFAWEDDCELVEQKPVERGANSDKKVEVSDKYKKGFECGKQYVIKYPQEFNLQPKQEWGEEDIEDELNEWIGCEACPEGINVSPLPKVIKIVDKTARHFYKLCLKKQKPVEWGEEDEEELKIIYAALEETGQYDSISWLKSLRERYTWKPSDEQIIALRWILNNVPYCKHKEEISGLLDQIKEL